MRSDIFARYIQFVRGLKLSAYMGVSVICGFRAVDINTGHNLNMIWWETGHEPLSASLVNIKAATGWQQ